MKKRNIWTAFTLCLMSTFSTYADVASTNCTTTYSTNTITSCSAYTWTNGVTYTVNNNTAKDTFVNAGGCDSIVTLDLKIEDKVNPTVIAKNITISLSAAGTATIVASQINNGSSDNCTIVSLSLNKSTFDCSNLGTNTVYLIAIDAFGNVGSAGAVVTVSDLIKPTAIAKNIDLSLNAIGQASITPTQIDNGSTDNCSVASFSVSKSSFNCANVGPNNVYLRVMDVYGNKDSALAIVTINDDRKPIVAAQNITISLNASGSASVTASQVDNGSTDNCSINSLSLSKTTFDCSNLGTNTVYLKAIDGSGNSDSAIAIITVQDTTKTVLKTKNITVNLGSSGTATINPSQIDNGSVGNCTVSYQLTKTSFNCGDIGPNTVYLIATDAAGNVNAASVTVTIADASKPSVVAQNITISLDPTGNGSITTSQLDTGSFDNCGIATLALSKSSFNCSNVGVNTVYVIATDVNGNSDSASAIVTVQDTSLSVLTQDLTVSLDSFGQASISVSDIDNGSSSSCGIATLALSKSSFDCSTIGANTIYLIATDVSGNIDSTMAIVNVEDTIQSNLMTQDIVVTLDSFGQASITTSQIDNGSSDNCNLTLTLSAFTFDCSNLGANVIYLIATDASGRIDSTSALVTVQDTIQTYLSAIDITVSLNAFGRATITPADIDNGSSDNCSLSLALSTSSFDCSNVGTNLVYLIATDASGNIDSASAIVTIQDTLKPIVRTKNISVVLDAFGNAFIQPFQVNMGSSDNCKIASFDLSKRDFDCSEIGNHVIYLFAEDFNGNRDSASAIVTVVDTKPVVRTQNITVYLGALGAASIATTQIDNGSSDDCGIASIALSKSNFNCANLGVNTVNLLVTDVNGNIGSGTAVVNVQDSIKPSAGAQDILVMLDENGLATITPSQIDNGSMDNCSIVSIALSKSNFDCSNIGGNIVYLMVTDASGNRDSVSAVVTIQDTTKPMVLTQSIVAFLDATGQVSITSTEIDRGSSDNCGISTLFLSKSSFDCSNLGTNPVYLIVTDVNGNVDSASALVTIKDTISPIIVNAPTDVAFGYCDAKYTYTLPIATDNCTFTVTQTGGLPPGSIFPQGFTTNAFKIEDLSGNAVTTSFTVEIRSEYLPFAFRDTTLCSNDAQIDLTKSAASLTFLGTGIQSDGINFNPILSGSGKFIITAVFTDSMGCTTLDSLSIVVRKAPVTPKIVREASDQIATELKYESYQWYRNGSFLAGENTQLYMAQELGIYSVVVSSADHCFAVSEGYDFGMPANEEQVVKDGNVRVYPNPTNGVVFAEIFDNDATHLLTLTDGLGAQLMIVTSNSRIVRIDMTDYASGAYFLNVTSASTNANVKIIKN